MDHGAIPARPPSTRSPRFRPPLLVVAGIGIAQILAWGSSYYLIAVVARPVAAATGWPLAWIVGGLSLGLLVSGLIAPAVGRLIERRGGRPVLAASALLLAAGLLLLAFAPDLPVFLVGWIVIGFGMGSGLYDPAFSALGRLYAENARSAITQVTLFGGFSSTVCWPLSAFLVDHVGWRGTCLAYAAILLAIVLPLYLLCLPREPARVPAAATARAASAGGAAPASAERNGGAAAFLVLAVGFTIAYAIMTIVAVHLLTLLQAFGVGAAAAVGFGTLLGPSQVGGRVLEMTLGRNTHPVWSMIASTVLVTIGLALLPFARGRPGAFVAVAIVLYGAGSGIRSIVRGTVPLALFGPDGYAVLMGRLGLPTLLAQAAAPSIGALLLDRLGAQGTMAALCGAAVLNILLSVLLLPFARRRTAAA
jgi:MFS family permease